MKKIVCLLSLLILVGACSSSDTPSQPDDDDPIVPEVSPIIDYQSLSDFNKITPAKAQSIRDSLNIYYGHTSHGRQLLEGMDILLSENGNLDSPSIHEVLDDLGHNGDTSWADLTRAHLDNKAAYTNVVMWSWCGGVSDNTPSGIETYLATMSALEAEYPDVDFVYMTGHLDGTGADGTLRVLNTQIRDYCSTNEKILFDFESIESYDPDGNYFADDSDDCQWCEDWCAANDCPQCDVCAHSHCYNCYRKGQAFWCLLAMILDRT